MAVMVADQGVTERIVVEVSRVAVVVVVVVAAPLE